jgi:hypothetical protein
MLVAANWQQKKDKEDVVQEHVPAYVTEVAMPEPEPIPEPEIDPEESNKWEKFTDKLKWSNVFTKPVPLPTDAKEIMTEFFQKEEVKTTKPVEYDSAGRRITPMTAEENRAKTIAQDVEDLQKPV